MEFYVYCIPLEILTIDAKLKAYTVGDAKLSLEVYSIDPKSSETKALLRGYGRGSIIPKYTSTVDAI